MTDVSEQSVPEGQWVVFDDGYAGSSRYRTREVAKATPKLIKFERGGYPSQISRVAVIASFADREAALTACQSLDGIEGEYQRRRKVAQRVFEERCAEAAEAKGKAVAKYLSLLAAPRAGEGE